MTTTNRNRLLAAGIRMTAVECAADWFTWDQRRAARILNAWQVSTLALGSSRLTYSLEISFDY